MSYYFTFSIKVKKNVSHFNLGIRLLKISLWLAASVILFTYRSVYSFDNLIKTTIVLTMTDILLLFGCSNIINRFLIPQLLYQRKIIKLILSSVLLIGMATYALQGMQWGWYISINSISTQAKEVFGEFTYQVFNSWMVIFFGCLSLFTFRLLNDHWISQHRYELLQKEKAQTELNFLKAQINPHFLFNSLNSIYGNIERTNSTARNILLSFSEMLRYQLYECNADRISIDKEMDYLKNYIELQKIRKEENLVIDVQIDPELKGIEVAPLLLIPFIENAFKYLSNNDRAENKIEISLRRLNNSLIFYVKNTRDRKYNGAILADKGIGINNVKRRLEILYPGKHELKINPAESTFEVSLIIELE